jgi:AMMECR1 domain-containing protein
MADIEHCFYCFDSLLNELEGRVLTEPKFDNIVCPVFVTWRNKETLDLRGCLGNFNPMVTFNLRPAYI